MSNKVPKEIADVVKKIVFDEADRADYFAMSKPDSGAFLDVLANHPDVGGKIEQYIKGNKVRHYIKDAILNHYSKEKKKNAIPNDNDICSIVKKVYRLDVEESDNENNVRLYRSKNSSRQNEYVVVVEGTYLKWETALRKALLFMVADKPFFKTASNVHILLLLFAKYRPIPPSDKKNLENALKRCGAFPHIFGER